MYSKFFQHSDVGALEQQLDTFLQELNEVTGQIVSLKLFRGDDNIIVLIIYNCWKKL